MPVLKTTGNFYDYEVSDQVAYNLQRWLDYGLIEIGAFTNITSGNVGYTLQRVTDPRYGDNKVFEGLGAGWVWESGISTVDGSTAPIRASGVYVNSTFYLTNTSTSGYANHYIDFENGRVIFSGAVPTSATVNGTYCAKHVGVYLADSNRWRKTVDDYISRYSTLSTLSPSGMAAIMKENRVWMPAVVIDMAENHADGLQLGGGEIRSCAVTYNVFSTNGFANKKICDLLVNQDEKRLNLFNVNTVPNLYNYNGTLASGAQSYKELVDSNSYFWTYADLSETNGGLVENLPDFYQGLVRQIVRVYRYNITY